MTERRGLERFVAACAANKGRLTATLVIAGVAIVVAGILLLAVAPVAWREGRGSPAPLAVLALVVAGLVTGGLVARRARAGLRPEGLANEADEAVGLGAGDLRGALELDAGHGRGSPELAALHRDRIAARLEGLTADRVLPRTGRIWSRRVRAAGGIAGLAIVALLASAVIRPDETRSAALALGAPWRTAFPPPLPPLELALEGNVSRGDLAALRIRAIGRSRVALAWRPAGRVAERRDVGIDVSGTATASIGPISAPTAVWVSDASGGSSDTLLVRPAEPLLVQDLIVEIEYPAYLDRPAESHRGQVPPLVLPEGSRLILSGESNLPLTEGILVWRPEGVPAEADGIRTELALDGARFGVTLRPDVSGAWEWRLAAAGAVGDPILPAPIEVVLVPDIAPAIQLLFPAPDTILGPDRVMPLVVDVEDDIGLGSVQMRSWRSGLGEERAERRETLAPSPAGSRRAVFRHLLDRSAEEMLPGDTIFYRFEAFDGHPTRGPALSDVFLLRVPTLTEIRDARADRTRELADAADALEQAMDELAEAAADAARRSEVGEEEGEPSFETTEEARSVLEDAERAAEDLSELEEAVAGLREDLARSAVSDEALAEQLEMLAERYRELMESGLAERIEELAEALQDLDPEAVRRALEELAEDSDRLREQLEQTLGSLEQAALDQELESARANAEDLAEAQRELAGEEGAESAEWTAEQERLAERAEQLAEALDELEERLETGGQPQAADSARAAGERTAEAMERMHEAAAAGESSAGGETPPEQSRDAASEAADAMEQAAGALGSAQQNMEQTGRDAAAQSLGRARAEALSLADEEGRLAAATRGETVQEPEAWRARQAAVRQGLENLLDRLSESGSEAAMLDQETGAAAGETAERMDRLLERLAEDGARRLPARAEVEGIQESLNRLAMRLLASEQAARAAQQRSQGQEAMEQMASLAQQQQAITQETSSLLVPGPKPAGEERSQEVSARQQEIADRLRELDDPEGDMLGRPEEMAREAGELARELAQNGPTQEALERQRRLFRRMLDAGRSLEDEDLDPNRRESTTGVAAPRDAPEIDPELLRGRRFPLPSEALIRELPIVYRSLIFDYFDRLNRRPPESDEPNPDGG